MMGAGRIDARASGSLSVIVPLAPGEIEAHGLLEQLSFLPAGSEVIVVRADDVSSPRPKNWPSRIHYVEVRCAPGRARQQNLGARSASGNWLWFLHADSRLSPQCLGALQAFVEQGSDALGWFDLAFRDDGPRLTALNAVGANWRSRWLRLPFGDQGLVLPRECFNALHGFDEQAPCGEDHLLIWAARRAGLPVRRIGATLETSARKYAQHGWLRTTLRHARLAWSQAWPLWRNARRTSR